MLFKGKYIMPVHIHFLTEVFFATDENPKALFGNGLTNSGMIFVVTWGHPSPLGKTSDLQTALSACIEAVSLCGSVRVARAPSIRSSSSGRISSGLEV